MAEDPHEDSDKDSRQAEGIINELNATWDLQLPLLHEIGAHSGEKGITVVASHCSAIIYFLCRKSVSLDAVLEDFNEQAISYLSRWIYKPSQERGTLPILPQSKSFVRRDELFGGVGHLGSNKRVVLLQLLASVLDEESKLTRESDVYERTSSGANSRCVSVSSSGVTSTTSLPSSLRHTLTKTAFPQTTNRTNHNMERSGLHKRESTIRKRNAKHERPKRSSKLLESYLTKQSDILMTCSPASKSKSESDSHETDSLRNEPDSASLPTLTTSFNTTISEDADKLFTDEEGDHSTISQATSVISDWNKCSQDLLPTQEVDDIMNDVSFTSNLEAADGKKSFCLEDLTGTGPFCKVYPPLPSGIPYWLMYDISRLSLLIQCSVWQIYRDVVLSFTSDQVTFNDFWQIAKRLYEGSNSIRALAKSDFRRWTCEEDRYENDRDGTSVYLTGKLELQTNGDLFRFSLGAAQIDRSCRFHREYGADRFMVITMPYMTTDQLPHQLRRQCLDAADSLHHKVVEWLSTQDHYIAGRIWRAFYLEPEKSQSKKRRDLEGQQQKLHLFAVDGPGLVPVPINDFMNWHTPFDHNLASPDLKLFARFGLGLSKTFSTIELQQTEFYHVEDLLDAPVMNDGCAMMSLQLAKAIWEMHGDLTDLPSAFQGRIGGAKGLWIVDYMNTRPALSERGYWIEVSDSQLKIKPHPRNRKDTSATLRTFELLAHSKPCTEGSLNTQLINILAHRGVSRSVLRNALLKDLREYISGAYAAMEDPRRLRAWMQQFHPASRRENESILFKGGLPASIEEEVCLLVESGFVPQECLRLRKAIKLIMTQALNLYVDKLKIRLSFSTNVYCVPDPYGVLESDEIFLGFSTEWNNPKTGLKETTLDDIEVLVARNPAHLASDIQKRKAVYKRELRHFKNVIVFSTKGLVPTASLLSGGDYDGDTVTVIWDPDITSAFLNADKPELPSEKACGMENKSHQLSERFSAHPTTEQISSFLTDCISFNAHPNLLGICTNEFEKLIYNTGNLSGHGAVQLAALAGYLVDSGKQGWYLSNTQWWKIRNQTCGSMRHEQPAYKTGDVPRRDDKDDNACRNVIDYLKFDVALKEKDNVLIQFKKCFSDDDTYDTRLSYLYNREENRAAKKSRDLEKHAIRQVMDDLKAKIQGFVDQWSKEVYGLNENADFGAIAERISACVREITPLDVSCDIVRDFHIDGGARGSRWSLLRASTMYHLHFRKTVIWYTVGDELCRLKARSKGWTRELVPDLYHVLKADVKLVEKLCTREVDATLRAGDM